MPKKKSDEMVDLHVRMPPPLKEAVQQKERGAEWIRKTLQAAVDAETERTTLEQIADRLSALEARLERLEEGR